MTVSSTTNKVSASGNGTQDTFAYTFKIFEDGDLDVYIRSADGTETLKTITTHYTVTNAGNEAGGNVVFTAGNIPASTESVIIQRKLGLTQGTDYVENDPFPAESHEEALDRLTFITQQMQEEIDRSIKASVTNTISSTEFTISAADRANKIFAFDGSGDLSVAQELGTFKGNWGASTTYAARDIVKDTSTNNIFLANTAHTSSGSQPLTSNTDSAKWDLIVDAASASASATAASTSATAAASSATAASTSATNAATSESNASTSATNAETAKTAAETAQTAAEAAQTAAESAQSSAEATFDLFDDAYLGAKATNPALDNDGAALQDGALYFDTTNNVMKVYDLGTTTWYQLTPTVANQTNINTVAGIEGDVTTVAGIDSDVTTVAGIDSDVTTVAGVSTEIGRLGTADAVADMNTLGTAAIVTDMDTLANISADITTLAHIEDGTDATDAIQTVASNVAAVQSFANVYRVESSDPTTSLDAGDLVFNTTDSLLKYYNGSSWASISPGIANVVEDTTPQLGGDLDTNGNDITFGDNDKAIFGAGSDLQIYHNSSNNRSFIAESGTADLYIQANDLRLVNADSSAFYAYFVNGGAASLYHNNSAKLATTSTGIDVTGDVSLTGNINLSGADAEAIGSSGNLRLESEDSMVFQCDNNNDASGVEGFYFRDGGNNTRLFIKEDGNVGIGTTSPSSKLDVTGTVTADGVSLSDNAFLYLGDGNDFFIRHDGTNTIMRESGSGGFFIDGENISFRNSNGTETYAEMFVDGAVYLRHNNIVKFETTSYGVDISGSVVADTHTDTSQSGSQTADFSTYQNFVWTLTGNVTLANPSTEKTGQSGFFIFIQDGTGSRTVSLGTDYETAGGAGLTLSTAANSVDIVPYVVQSSGNILLGTPQLAFS